MALQFTSTDRDTFNNAIITSVGTGGIYKIYSGSVPANVAASLGAAVLLSTLPVTGAFGTESAGVITLTNPAVDSAPAANGTAAFFRITTSGGTAKIQGLCGTSGSDMNLNTTSIVTTGTVTISGTNTITAPGA